MNTEEKIKGLGPLLHEKGVAFRVWAPHAKQVSVVGSFNNWEQFKNIMETEGNGFWYTNITEAHVGDEYLYQLSTTNGELKRIDPCAREVSNSNGNSIVHDPHFDWKSDTFKTPSWNELVIYELHIGTFNDQTNKDKPGQFSSVTAKLDYLKNLGINAIQIMPISEFAGDRSWGYNPSHIFSVESTYGGPKAFKEFIKNAHQAGIAVILDVVYNHFGPSDLALWKFDGWSENNLGGIYFYNNILANTPWGNTRPDFGRGEVRQYILDNVLMWFEEYHIDGIRFDCTQFIHKINGAGSPDLPEGWSLLQWINSQIAQKFPGRITIAEDLSNNKWITKEIGAGGAGFSTQWDARFVHPIRQTVIVPNDVQRSIYAIRDAICCRYNDDAFDRVIYSESHDEVANGKARVPQEINPNDPTGWYAKKRSTLAAAMVFTSPGIPMIFQGQEFLEGGWFRDNVPVDWHKCDTFFGIVLLYRDLINLRMNRNKFSRGLCGQFTNVYHVNDDEKVIAYHRWDKGGRGDDVIIVANFSCVEKKDYRIGFPGYGSWKLRFNSDSKIYNEEFKSFPSVEIVARSESYDSLPFSSAISIGPYSVLIFSQ